MVKRIKFEGSDNSSEKMSEWRTHEGKVVKTSLKVKSEVMMAKANMDFLLHFINEAKAQKDLREERKLISKLVEVRKVLVDLGYFKPTTTDVKKPEEPVRTPIKVEEVSGSIARRINSPSLTEVNGFRDMVIIIESLVAFVKASYGIKEVTLNEVVRAIEELGDVDGKERMALIREKYYFSIELQPEYPVSTTEDIHELSAFVLGYKSKYEGRREP